MRNFALLPLCLLAALPSLPAQPSPARERINFDAGWRFIKDDPAGIGPSLTYAALKPALLASAGSPDLVVRPTEANPGAEVTYAQPGFDDRAWRQLDLPHDWGIEAPFDQGLPGGTGKLPYFGVGWYRKTFNLPAGDAGRSVFLAVDGAMAYASVWLNGRYLGGWPYGYNSFKVELTSALKPGADNVLAIRLDNPNTSSRWYPGGGIYRNVWLETMAPVHVAHGGTYVTTPDVTAGSATVNLTVAVDNASPAAAMATVRTQIFALDAAGQISGRAVATANAPEIALDRNGTKTAALTTKISNPKLWGLKSPQLYAAVTTITQNGRVVDQTTTAFGIRTIKFDPNRGFFLNGEHVLIKGVCDHADLGALGSVVNVRGLERQIQLLQEMGCNAIRTAHAMPAPELLDLCDRLGMLVMDESFDCWERQKTANDYHLLFPDWHEKDLRAAVRRDRNHPSVILWSIGNEVGEQGSPRGREIGLELTKIVHAEDPTRMTITANNQRAVSLSGLPADEYAYGFNYEPYNGLKYATYHAEQNPNGVMIGSETASALSSRGFYLFPVSLDKNAGTDPATFQVSSYDVYAAPWANLPDVEFRDQELNPAVAGEFVWTGFDYLGEPTRSEPRGSTTGRNATSRSSYFGIIDLAGFKKDRFYLYQAHWRPDLPMAHLVPQNWNWRGFEGEVTPVHVYTTGDEAELFLNGVSQGRVKKVPFQSADPLTDPVYRIRFDNVRYQGGELKVIAYRNGKKWAEDTMKTTGPAAKLSLAPDRATINADGQDLSYVTVAVQDAAGLTVPDAMNALHCEITGPGEIAGVDNGDPTSHALMQGTKEGKVFYGLALVIIRSKPGQRGAVTLRVQSDGLTAASVTIAKH